MKANTLFLFFIKLCNSVGVLSFKENKVGER